MHPPYHALPAPYLSVRVTSGALVTHRYTSAPPSCKTSQCQCNSIFIPPSVSLWNDLGDPLFDGEGLAEYKNRANAFSGLSYLLIFCALLFLFLFFLSVNYYCEAGVYGLTLPALHHRKFLKY